MKRGTKSHPVPIDAEVLVETLQPSGNYRLEGWAVIVARLERENRYQVRFLEGDGKIVDRTVQAYAKRRKKPTTGRAS